MKRHISLLLGALMLVVLGGTGRGDQARALPVPFAEPSAWKTFADEPWWSLLDLRDVLNIFHPLVVSRTGAAAGASQVLTIPADWKPPFALRFWCADDYFADPDDHKPGQPGTESFFAHRFKQVLIDGEVVWSRDVTDENTLDSQTIFRLDVTPHVTPGKPFTLTFRVFDQSSTLERGERDVWFIPGTWYAPGDGTAEEEPRFHTSVWFADPVIGEATAVEAAPPGVRPHEAVVAARHAARWPLPPPGDAMPSLVTLSLVSPARIPAPGFPITCGIPMPPGMLRDASAVRLRDPNGRELPVQTRVTGVWPDGSIRWLLLDAVAPEGATPGAPFRLHLNEGQAPRPRAPLRLERREGRVTIDTGPLRLELGRDPRTLIDAVYLAGDAEPLLTDLAPRMALLVDGAPVSVTATPGQARVVEKGPLAAQVELAGSLDAADRHIGRFVFRIRAYAGLPSVRMQFRVFNDVKPDPYLGTADDAPLEVRDLALVANLPGGIASTAVGVVGAAPIESEGGLALQQTAPDHFDAAGAEGERAQGWIAAQSGRGCVQASVWRFWQQYPKSLQAGAGRLEIGLVAPQESAPAYRPRFGEAKRHDIWLTFSRHRSADRQALGLLADEPPRLFDREWFCRSGGVNVLDPRWFERHPQLKTYVANAYGDVSTARVTGRFGLRDFGDMPYGSQGQWLNGYWAMVQGALNWGLASGDQRWLERSFEIARHIADVDSVHVPPGHPDWGEWNGVICALGTDHSVHNGLARWPAFQIGESLILHYWMTGDPDSLEAALANADYIIRSRAGLGSVEARSQARPLLTLLRAWQATGDPRYRDAAARYCDLDFQTQTVIEPRRGAYIQPTYQNWRCVSAGLDSMYAQNVYEYYRLTGDLGAAQLVVAIADSIYAEAMLPQEEGLGSFIYYPRYSRNAWYYPQMALLFHIAYDLTGDLRFLRAGRAAFARYLLCQDASGNPMYQPVHNFGWLDPEFGGWERRFEGVATQPFEIASQTPDPDPARYAP